jgi:hypothetical protein
MGEYPDEEDDEEESPVTGWSWCLSIVRWTSLLLAVSRVM